MTQRRCARESSVVASIRSGAWSAELESHVGACAICAETRRVAQLCIDHAATVSAQNQPVAAHIIWQRMQARRQQLVLVRATRWIAWMRLLAGLYVLALAAWFLPQLWRLQHAPLAASLNALSGGTVLASMLAAIGVVILGSCCLMFLGSKINFGLPT